MPRTEFEKFDLAVQIFIKGFLGLVILVIVGGAIALGCLIYHGITASIEEQRTRDSVYRQSFYEKCDVGEVIGFDFLELDRCTARQLARSNNSNEER